MKKELLKKIYETVDNQWLFIMKATERYKEEFRKTAKIGEPPKIEDVMELVLNNGNAAAVPEQEPDKPADKKKKKADEEKASDKKEG